MNFEIIKANIITILGAGAAGRYRTVGYEPQGSSAAINENLDRSVQVFYASGNFPKSGASLHGPIKHDMTFRVELIASKAATVDLATLESDLSTNAQRAVALAALQKAAFLADASVDGLLAVVFNVLMDNSDLDLGPGIVASSRWFTGFQKDAPHPRGSLVTVTGSSTFTCNYPETLSGVEALNVDSEGVIQPTTIDVDVINDDDDATKQGATIVNPGP